MRAIVVMHKTGRSWADLSGGSLLIDERVHDGNRRDENERENVCVEKLGGQRPWCARRLW